MTSTKYIGMDVHKESISIAVLNFAGKVVMECVIETKANHTKSLTWPGLTSQIQSIRRKMPDSRQIGTKRRWWMTLDSRSLDFVIAGA